MIGQTLNYRTRIEAREQGPVSRGYSLVSSVRFIVWRFIHLGIMIWNSVEPGLRGSGVFTRFFLISGVMP